DEKDRRVWRTIAAEELRHHKGFVRRLEALGADPERAMRPFRASLDHFHAAAPASNEVEAAVTDLLGEGIATDLLEWLRRVADPDTAQFVDTVIADEVGHEGRAAAEVRRLMDGDPDGRRHGARAARGMLVRMAGSGPATGPAFGAFLRLGRGHELLAAVAGGYARRLHLLGIGPLRTLERLDPLGIVARLDPFGAPGASRPAA
ncbi:MAG: ferritin-like fold-containing protein, partial [Acidimicrobiales bacterium]